MLRNLILAIILVVSGCSGDINEGEGSNPEFEDRRFQTNCKINSDEMSRILREPIPEQINCIYNKLNLFMDLVEPERKELGKTLSRDVLERYIRTNEEDAEDIIKYLDVFFNLNYLVFGTDYGFINKDNFAKLKDFLILFNREFSSVYKYLKPYVGSIKIKSHNKIKEKVLQAARNIVKDGMVIVESSKGDNVEVNRSLESLLEKLEKSRSVRISTILDYFETEDNKEDLEKVKKLLYVKKVILGGDPDILTLDEFVDLVRNKMVNIGDILFDMFKLKDIVFDTEEKRYNLYSNNLDRIKEVLASQHDNPEVLITYRNIFDTINMYKDDIFGEDSDFDIEKYELELERVKEVLLGSNGEFTARDIFKILDHLKELSRVGQNYSKSFQENKKKILGSEKLFAKELTNNSGVESNYFKSFALVLEKYRYFKGDEILPSYQDEYVRNIKGIIEIGQLEYIIDILIRFYEKEYPCHLRGPHMVRNPYTGKMEEKNQWDDFMCSGDRKAGTVNVGQIYYIILELRRFLHDVYIVLPGREDKSAETVALMTDLFQHSSNGDAYIQKNELVEFAYQMLNAIEMSENVEGYFKRASKDPNNPNNCRVIEEDDPANDPVRSRLFEVPRYLVKDCFRPEFFNIFAEPFEDDSSFGFTYSYFDYFPKFRDYYNSIKQKGNQVEKFITEMENFTRVCTFENIPMSQADVLGVYAGLFNVEATLNRFDVNGSNVIEVGAELNEAYLHFQKAIEGIVRDSNGPKSITRKVFDFLTVKMRPPTTLEGLGMVFGIGPKPQNTDRFTLAKILVSLQTTSEEKREKRLGDLYVPEAEYCSDFIPRVKDVPIAPMPLKTVFPDDVSLTPYLTPQQENFIFLKMRGL